MRYGRKVLEAQKKRDAACQRKLCPIPVGNQRQGQVSVEREGARVQENCSEPSLANRNGNRREVDNAESGSSSKLFTRCGSHSTQNDYAGHKRQRVAHDGCELGLTDTQWAQQCSDVFPQSSSSLELTLNASNTGILSSSSGECSPPSGTRAACSVPSDFNKRPDAMVSIPPEILPGAEQPRQPGVFPPCYGANSPASSCNHPVPKKHSPEWSLQTPHGNRDSCSHISQPGISDTGAAAIRRLVGAKYCDASVDAYSNNVDKQKKNDAANNLATVRWGDWKTPRLYYNVSGAGQQTADWQSEGKSSQQQVPTLCDETLRNVSSQHMFSSTNCDYHLQDNTTRGSSGGWDTYSDGRMSRHAAHGCRNSCDAGSDLREPHNGSSPSPHGAPPYGNNSPRECHYAPQSYVEHSGFINPENDCYACSVLTLLLRSPVFSAALLSTPGGRYMPPGQPNNCTEASSNNTHQTTHDVKLGSISPDSSGEEASCDSLHDVLRYFAGLLQFPHEIERGIDMGPLRNLFKGVFFSGQQEDAHEFFLAVIDKLSEEAKMALNTSDATQETDALVKPSDEAGNGVCDDDNARTASTKGSAGSPVNDPIPGSVSSLVTGQLLSIIRCGNAACGHEIATVDPFTNLLVNLRKEEETVEPSTQPITCSSLSQQSERSSCAPQSHEWGCDLVSSNGVASKWQNNVMSLLMHSFHFSVLDSYVCDACKSSNKQSQGGCLLGAPPPILVVQMKRFTTTYSPHVGACMSKDVSSVVVNRKIVLYSLDEEHYNFEEKMLKPNVLEAERKAKQQSEGEVVDDAATHVKAIRSVYRLQGMVRHLGRSLYGGHYVAEFARDREPSDDGREGEEGVEGAEKEGRELKGVVRLREDKADNERGSAEFDMSNRSGDKGEHMGFQPAERRVWYIADDDRVSVRPDECAKKDAIRSSSCYLLLYEKMEEEAVSSHVWNVLPRCE